MTSILNPKGLTRHSSAKWNILGRSALVPHTRTKEDYNIDHAITSRRLPQIIRDTRLGTEIIDNGRRISRHRILRHGSEEVLQLTEVLALARRSALDEFFPRFGVREAGVDYAVEDVVLGFDGDDGAVGAVLEELCLVLLS